MCSNVHLYNDFSLDYAYMNEIQYKNKEIMNYK